MAITWNGDAWIALTPYVLYQRAVKGGNVYSCTTAGTSAASGGPSGTSPAITDGSVVWKYEGPSAGTVTAVAAELSTAPAITQVFMLNAADQLCNARAWGARRDTGMAYLAAHLATLARLRGVGAVTSEAVGQFSRSYLTPQGVRGSLGLTAYGAEYERQSRLLPTVVGLVP